MSDIIIKVESMWKQYRYGVIGHGTLVKDFERWWARIRGKEDPFARVDDTSNPGLDGERFWALQDINFEVKRGERVGIIGKNGSGKSTLLKLLSRVTLPTQGTAKIKGRLASLLEVGTGFHPELTGRENIFLNGAILGMTKHEILEQMDQIIDFSGIQKFIDTPVKRYSSGMYVRLAFAVAAHLNVEILLVDEVLAVGDIEFQKKCMGKMEDIGREGRTVMFVSHNMFSMKNLCDRGILLDTGKIVAQGPITEVIEQYMQTGEGQQGEISWSSPENAPGDHRVKLKAMRIVSEGKTTDTVDISKSFRIEMDYWNLAQDERRYVSIHLYNGMGIQVLVSANFPSACHEPDPWFEKSYPTGLFRTYCEIPGTLLNDGQYSVFMAINPPICNDPMVSVKDLLTFTVKDTGEMRKEHILEWPGAVRPRLGWGTEQLD